VDYETLAKLGSIMGSGGMVVMDEDNCMWTWRATSSSSPFRILRQVRTLPRGARQALKILNGFTNGNGRGGPGKPDELGRMIRDMSCAVGQTAPNPC